MVQRGAGKSAIYALLQNKETELSRRNVTLAELWKLDVDATTKVADELAEVGFFEKGGTKERPEYKVPFLYRSAFGITQGTAE